MEDLSIKYPWLDKKPGTASEYLSPSYYASLLKNYSFGGATDLDLLRQFLSTEPGRETASWLELGCGPGRATDVLLEHSPDRLSLDLVDLSAQMCAHATERFRDRPGVTVRQSDSIDFLGQTAQRYDRVFSLWNLSHSIHQHLLARGVSEGTDHVCSALSRFLEQGLLPGGFCYLIHYDIQSPEQRLINPWRSLLWERVFPDYDMSGQSLSKLILDEVLSTEQDAGLVTVECERLSGDPIVYASVDQALEVFMNFHMESHFNDHPRLPEIIGSLRAGLSAHRVGDEVYVPPSCFVYTVRRTG